MSSIPISLNTQYDISGWYIQQYITGRQGRGIDTQIQVMTRI